MEKMAKQKSMFIVGSILIVLLIVGYVSLDFNTDIDTTTSTSSSTTTTTTPETLWGSFTV